METIKNIINNYAYLLVFINRLELTVSLLFLILPKKRDWQDYIVCFYGGFLFGMIPFFAVLKDIFAAFIGSAIISSGLIYLQRKLKTELYIPLGIVVFKILFIIGIGLCEEKYYSNMFNFYLLLVFLSVVVFLTINIPFEISEKWQYFIIRLFALLELSGAIIQMYRSDYSAFNKDLYAKETVSLFLYLLKIDFTIFSYQSLYILCFCALLFIYFVWIKVICLFRIIWIKCMGFQKN